MGQFVRGDRTPPVRFGRAYLLAARAFVGLVRLRLRGFEHGRGLAVLGRDLGAVELEQQLARRDAVAFVHVQLRHACADLRRDVDRVGIGHALHEIAAAAEREPDAAGDQQQHEYEQGQHRTTPARRIAVGAGRRFGRRWRIHGISTFSAVRR